MSQWLRSSRANTLFLYSARVVVCVGMFMIFMLTPWFQEIETVPRGRLVLQVLGGTLGVVGAPAALVIWFGMAAFCLREDRSHVSTKISWFILFFVAAWFGSAAYFFMVYRKQVQGISKAALP
jgi:hypothetical protein